MLSSSLTVFPSLATTWSTCWCFYSTARPQTELSLHQPLAPAASQHKLSKARTRLAQARPADSDTARRLQEKLKYFLPPSFYHHLYTLTRTIINKYRENNWLSFITTGSYVIIIKAKSIKVMFCIYHEVTVSQSDKSIVIGCHHGCIFFQIRREPPRER